MPGCLDDFLTTLKTHSTGMPMCWLMVSHGYKIETFNDGRLLVMIRLVGVILLGSTRTADENPFRNIWSPNGIAAGVPEYGVFLATA